MRWIRGSALFAAGTLLGIFLMTPAASPQVKTAGLTLNHFGIYAKDMDESVKFYTEKMGFREVFRFKDGAGNPIVYLQIDRNTFLEMTPADKDHAPGFSHAGILSDDVAATVAGLQKKGQKAEDVHLGGTKALISNTLDPNGVRLELLSYPPESLQRKAMDSWK
ncbi:MAG: VOC family protein [Acidobacteriia bacterium]|nr:VOC family protein [Terriglobia bacterium]